MALVTDKFRIYAAEAFRNTLGSTGSDANKVYLFVGRPKVWGNPDSPPTNEPIDSFTYHRQTYGDSVAFKRVDITDTSLVVPRVDWIDPTETTGGTVTLWDNDLTAVKSTDTTDAETATATTGADGGSADVGTLNKTLLILKQIHLSLPMTDNQHSTVSL